MSDIKISDAVRAVQPWVIATRRDLHRHPELGFEEVRTSGIVAQRLTALGLQPRTGIAGTGVTAVIEGGAGDGPTVLLRADMDALPVHEENDVDYRSTVDGKMHACGHDGHTAMLLGVAEILQAERAALRGRVKVLFQPAEETPGGAQPMIEQGALEDPKVDFAFGLHLWSPLPTGVISVAAGPIMASSDVIDIEVTGRGGHAAMPAICIDPVTAAAQMITGLQTIVSRNVAPLDPAVVSITELHAGHTFNVIPDTARLRGTARTFSEPVRAVIESRLGTMVPKLAEAFGATATLRYGRGYPVTINDGAMAALVRAAAAEVVGDEGVVPTEPVLGAEDFAYFLQAVPGCFFMVGIRNDAKHAGAAHHNPRFDIDEDAMAIGMETMLRAARRALAS